MTIEAIVARYGLAAIFLGAGLEGETAVVAGGIIAHQGLVPLTGAMAASVAGSFAADQLFFAVGRRFRDGAIVRRMRARKAFARALGLLERYPRSFIFAYRFIYGIRTASPIAIGTSKVRSSVFVPVNALAAVIWGCLFTAIGYVFGNGLEQLLHRLRPSREVVIGGIVAVVIAFALWHAIRWYRAR